MIYIQHGRQGRQMVVSSLFPHITIATSSRGNSCVGVLIYPAVMALWTAPFAVVSQTQLSCWTNGLMTTDAREDTCPCAPLYVGI